ncbi:MAG: hypothetical protein MPL62_11040 [Alphaproteobacteria bacterium]|nr:hypothetical protein [Alphaproteobacteria bacterium]
MKWRELAVSAVLPDDPFNCLIDKNTLCLVYDLISTKSNYQATVKLTSAGREIIGEKF